MKMTYDPEVDILYIRLEGTRIADSNEVEEGVVLDYNAFGQVVGMEIQDASDHVAALKTVQLPPLRITAG